MFTQTIQIVQGAPTKHDGFAVPEKQEGGAIRQGHSEHAFTLHSKLFCDCKRYKKNCLSKNIYTTKNDEVNHLDIIEEDGLLEEDNNVIEH